MAFENGSGCSADLAWCMDCEGCGVHDVGHTAGVDVGEFLECAACSEWRCRGVGVDDVGPPPLMTAALADDWTDLNVSQDWLAASVSAVQLQRYSKLTKQSRESRVAIISVGVGWYAYPNRRFFQLIQPVIPVRKMVRSLSRFRRPPNGRRGSTFRNSAVTDRPVDRLFAMSSMSGSGWP